MVRNLNVNPPGEFLSGDAPEKLKKSADSRHLRYKKGTWVGHGARFTIKGWKILVLIYVIEESLEHWILYFKNIFTERNFFLELVEVGGWSWSWRSSRRWHRRLLYFTYCARSTCVKAMISARIEPATTCTQPANSTDRPSGHLVIWVLWDDFWEVGVNVHTPAWGQYG